MEHLHVSAVDALVIIAVYLLFKTFLAIARAQLDDENPIIRALNAIQA